MGKSGDIVLSSLEQVLKNQVQILKAIKSRSTYHAGKKKHIKESEELIEDLAK